MVEPGEADRATSGRSPSESFGAAGRDLRDLFDGASLYASAFADSWRLKARKIGLLAAMAVAALVIFAGVLAGAGVMIVVGLAEGLARLFGSVWLGDLVAGLLITVLAVGGTLIGIKLLLRAARRKLRQKYERLKADGRG